MEMGEAEEFAVYLNQAGELLMIPQEWDAIAVTIDASSFEIFSFVPILKLAPDVKVAPIGLVNMLNSAGTVLEVEHHENKIVEVAWELKVKGGGNLLVYSSRKPKRCTLNGFDKGVLWKQQKLIMEIPWEMMSSGVSNVAFAYWAIIICIFRVILFAQEKKYMQSNFLHNL